MLSDAQVNASILNAIKQFKSADEMKRKKGNEATPIKSGHFNDLNDINEEEKSPDPNNSYEFGSQHHKPNIYIEQIDEDFTDSKT